MDNKDIEEIILKVAHNHRKKFFGYYTTEDIMQEICLMCWEKVKDFEIKRAKQKDPKKALECFLNSVIANRLINFHRDNFIVPQQLHKEKKNNLVTLGSLSPEFTTPQTIDLLGIMEYKELWDFLLESLTEEEIYILDTLMSGEKPSSYYVNKLYQRVKDVIEEYGNR